MKKSSLTMLLCLLLCASVLVAPVGIGIVAQAEEDATPTPTVIESTPYSIEQEFEPVQTGSKPVTDQDGNPVLDENGDPMTTPVYEMPYYTFTYTAERAGLLHVTVANDATYVYIEKNGVQASAPLEVEEGDEIYIEFIAIDASMYATDTMTVELTDFPLGSRQNPIPLTYAEMEAGVEIEMAASGTQWYSFVAPETGLLDFVATKISWNFALCYNGSKEDPNRLDILGYYAPQGQLAVTAGETYLLCADVYNSEERTLHFNAKYVPPFTIDAATQKVMFNGLYQFKSEEARLFGVEFSYDRKTVSVLDVKNDEFLGTYNFNYNLKNGALELTDDYGEKAPFEILVVEDASAALGAYLKLNYNGTYVLAELTDKDLEDLKPSAEAIRTLTGTYEDIIDGELYGTYVFDYASMTVVVSTPWDPEPVVYNIVSYGVFNGELLMQSAAGDEIVMQAIGGEILYYGTPLVPVHVHEYKEDVKNPTCEEGGYTIFTCDCGETYNGDETPAIGHNWMNATCDTPSTCANCAQTMGEALGHDMQPATCDKPASCSRCEHTEGEALGHDMQPATCDKPAGCSRCEYTEGEALGHKWEEATCTAPKTCATCGATDGQERGHEFNPATCTEPKTCKVCQATEGKEMGHTWVEATCTTAKTCSVCDVTEGNALDHDMQPATCTKPSTCSRCDRVEGQPTEHNWNEGVVTKEPTEASDGEKLLTCQDCGAEKTQVIPSLVHVHSYTASVTEPNCTEKGYTTHTCACGDSYTDSEVKALGHDWNAADCTTAKTCKRCGDTEGKAAGHDWKDATCTTPKTCKACGKTEGGLVNHNWLAATCTTPKTCKDCGTTEGGLADHKMEAATCDNPKTCSACGHTEGESLGHEYSAATCTTPMTCVRCGKIVGTVEPHSYNAVQGGGMITYTCTVCGHSYQENANAIAITVPGALTGTFHGTQDYTWTATENGYLQVDTDAATRLRAKIYVTINGETAEATVIGYVVTAGDVVVITVETTSEVEINIPVTFNNGSGDAPLDFELPLGGDFTRPMIWQAPYSGQVTFVISATNLPAGMTLDNVTFRIIDGNENWHNHYDDEFGVDADGNHYITLEVSQGEILRLAAYADDFDTDGSLTITVQEGGPSVHEHTFEETERKEPTCTKNGYVRYTCTVCGEEKLEKLGKLGHTEEVIPGKTPTCTETGLTEGSKCSVCGEVIIEQTEIAVTDHTWLDATCEKPKSCANCDATEGEPKAHKPGIWVVDKAPTTSAEGSRCKYCDLCGNAVESEVIQKLNQGKVEDYTDKEDNAFAGQFSGSAEDLADKLLTEDEKAFIQQGEQVTISMKVEDISQNIIETEKEKIHANLGSNTLGLVLDITLTKQVGAGELQTITQANGLIVVTIEVPAQLQNTDPTLVRSYKIIRIHEGVATVLEAAFDETTGKLSFETDAFSTYAVVYSDAAVEDVEPTDPTQPTEPTTKPATQPTTQPNGNGGNEGGNNTVIIIVIVAVVLVAGAVAAFIVAKKKK